MDYRKINSLSSEAKVLKDELGITPEQMVKAARLLAIMEEMQHLATKRTSQQWALRQTLLAMGIELDKPEKLKTWYRSCWDKEGNDARFAKDFDSFYDWFQEYLTDERETPHDIYASHLARIEDSLTPEWKAYYFYIRTWGMPLADS